MDHDLCVGKRESLSLRSGGEQKGPHTGCHADADGGNITLYILHGVINSHAVGDRPAGTVDVKLDVLVRVLCLQIEKLCHHQTGRSGVHFFPQKDNTVVKQTGEDVVGPLSAVGLFNNIGY